MAFLVEDGTGLAGATSYLSVANFQSHHADRNVSTSDFNTPQIQGALVQATDYIDKRFGRRFIGFRKTKAQGLEWPRYDAYDHDDYLFDTNVVPQPLQQATAEYALIALQLSRNLAPIPGVNFAITSTDGTVTPPEGGGQLKRKREKVGPIEEETEYATPNQPMSSTGNMTQQIPEYPQADLWIEQLLGPKSLEIVRG